MLQPDMGDHGQSNHNDGANPQSDDANGQATYTVTPSTPRDGVDQPTEGRASNCDDYAHHAATDNAQLPAAREVPGLTITAPRSDDLGSQRSQGGMSKRSVPTSDRESQHHTSSRSTHSEGVLSKSGPHSQRASARSRQVTSRLDLALQDEPVTRDASAFQSWTPSQDHARHGDESYKIGPFVLLLFDEFCRHYALTDTALALQHELQELNVEMPDSDLWFDMYGQCRTILGNKKHTNPLATATTIERLVEFCVNPQARKAVMSLDMVAAHTPIHVCPSPKRATSTTNGEGSYTLMTAYQQLRSPIVRPSHRPNRAAQKTIPEAAPRSPVEDDAALEVSGPEIDEARLEQASPSRYPESPHRKSSTFSMYAKKKTRKSRQYRSHSVISMVSHSSGHHHHAPVSHGTYGEPVLAEGHLTDLKRDLTSTRLLEKELRYVRLEKILTEPILTTQKKLGFYTLTAEEQRARQQLQDPYANELILEKYGFSKRQECALCQFPYLQFNLPHKVSFKCIMDVYDHWQYVPPDRDTASKYKAPLCYDAVHVCRMCAQIVFQFAKQPTSLAVSTRPLSRKHRKAKSLATLRPPEPEQDVSFCSDPYALPPLLGDDVYDHRDMAGAYRRRGFRGDGEPSDGDGRAIGMSESPAKAIVYSQQTDGTPFMSAKEWSVINPEKSVTRHCMETIAAPPAKHKV